MRVLLAAFFTAVAAIPVTAAEQRFARIVTLPPRSPIQIDATIAEVTIEGSARADFSLQVTRRAPTDADLAKYPLVFDDTQGALRVTAVQADGQVNPELKTEIRLAVPADAVVESLKVFEGRVRLVNLHGTCDVAVRRGDIEGSGLGGRVRLATDLGSIDLRNAELSAEGMMHLRVFNGDARIRLARRPADARILAVTYNGTLTSDIPLTMKDKFGPRFGETTLGRGEPVLSIDVVKGNVAIRVG